MITLSPGRTVSRSGARAGLMRRTALGGVLVVMANAGAAAASPVLSSIPSQVVHAPVITTPSANLTSVTLKQSRTLINWSSFDIAQGQQVDFLFQNNAGIVLNRVGSLAVINGKLLGCVITCGASGSIGGNVWIFSPQGVVFGPHAQVNVGGLLATTSPLLSDQAFLDGSQLSFNFGGGPANAGVTVQSGAQLTAHGALALISPSVTTQAGSKITAGGTVLYGAAQNYVIHFDDSGGHGLNLVDFEVPASALTDGTISATPLTLAGDTAAGKIIVAAVSQPSVMNAVISLGGAMMANTASDGGGGDIVLTASGGPASVNITGALQASHGISLQAPDGGSIIISGSVSAASAAGAGGLIQVGGAGTGAADLTASGRLDASSAGAGQSGGQVVLTAGAVRLDGAIAATGPAGGGTILVGGGAQGKDASVANAETTVVGPSALIDASAGGKGDGGHVVVWSNQDTQFQGTILGRSGPSGGAGGAAEVSSAGYLSYAGAVDLRAADGTAGQLLLDPSELVVVQTGGTTSVSGGVNPAATSPTSTIGADTIDAALLTSDLTISTHMSLSGGNGVIEFNGGGAGPLLFNYGGSATRTLSFVPENGFLFTTSVGTSGPLNLTLNAGAAAVTVPTATSISVNGGNLTLDGSNLFLTGNLSANQVILTATGAIDQSVGGVSASSLNASAVTGLSLTGANTIGSLGALTNTTSGGLAFANTGGIVLIGNIAASGQAVSLVSNSGAITQSGGVITAGVLTASSVTGLSLTGANAVDNVGALVNTTSGGVNFTDAKSFNLTGNVAALGQAADLVSSNGSINQVSGVITADTLTASSATGLNLSQANQVNTVTSLSSSQPGDVTFSDNQTVTVDAVSMVSGSLLLGTTAGDLDLPNPVNAPGSLQLIAAGAVNGVSATSTAGPISLIGASVTFSGAVNSGGDLTILAENGVAATVSLGSATAAGNYSVTGAAINQPALQPTLTGATSNLRIDFTNAATPTDLTNIPLSAPGSVSVTTANSLVIGDVTAGVGVTLTSAGGLYEPSCDGCYYSYHIVAPSLTATAVNGINLYDPNQVSTVLSLTNTGEGSITFQNSQSVTINSVNLSSGSLTLGTSTGDMILANAVNIPGSVQINSSNGNLTVNGITTPSSVSLYAPGGALTETAAGAITLGGGYSATGLTINPAAEQPNFTAGSFGGLSLTFYQTGGAIDLTGRPLSAPGSVYVASNGENLTVDAITAGGDVTLYSAGALAAAPGTTINLSGNYSATGITISSANPTVLQPTFATGAGGNLSLTFNDPSGGTISLAGTPLTAPASVSVTASTDSLTVDSITAGSNVTLSSGGVLAAAPRATISLLGSYTASASTISAANPTVLQPTFTTGSFGSLSLTFNDTSGGTINLTGTPLTAPNNVSVTANSDSLIVDAITPGQEAFVTAGGTLTTAAISAGYYVSLNAGGAMTTGTINSGAYAFLQAGGSLTTAAISAGYDASLNANGAMTTGTINSGTYATLQAQGALTVNSITAPVITLSSGGVLSAVSGAVISPGSSYSATAVTFDPTNPTVLQPTFTVGSGASLSLTFNDSSGAAVNLTSTPLSAPGSVSVAATNDPLTVGSITAGSNVTLYTAGLLSAASGAVISLAGNYTATAVNISTANRTVLQPTFTSGAFGGLSLTFTENIGGVINLTGFPLAAPGSVSVTATSEPLTVDAITAGGDIALSTPGALNAALMATFNLGGNYYATGNTISPQLFQPTFTSGSAGSLSLTFLQSGGATDLTGFALTAPGSISISAPGGNLTVASLTAGANVTLGSGGVLAAAPGAAISLLGYYTATASTISAANPTVLQPTFLTGAYGGLSLTFDDTSGGTINLAGTPLTAPYQVSVTANGDSLTLDTLTAGQYVTVSAGGALTTGAISSGYDVNLNAGGAMSTGAINSSPSGNLQYVNLQAGGPLTVNSITAGSNIGLSSGSVLSAASGAVINAGGGSYSATAVTIDPTNPTVLQPTFTPGSFGSLSLTFIDTGSTTDLTAIALSAPGSVSITAGEYYLGGNQNLIIGPIKAGNGVSLNSTGTITQASGVITANSLSATAYNGITLNSPNAVGGLGSLYNVYTGGISFTNVGDIILGSVSAYGQTVNLVSINGALTESEGSIYAGVFTGSAVTGVNLTGFNQVSSLGPVTNSGTGGISFTNYYTDLVLAGDITAAGQPVSLAVTNGMLNQTSGVITGSALTASATNGIALNDANVVAALGLFSNSYFGGISFTNAGDFALTANVTASGQTVNLVSLGGAITQSGGVIIADTVTGAAVNGVTLNGANTVNVLGSMSNSASGGISFTNVGDLMIGGDVTAAGQVVNLVSSTGALAQATDVTNNTITAGTLIASAVNGVNFAYANMVGSLGAISNSGAGGISFTNAGAFTLTDNITAAGQNVSLTSNAGSMSQTGGVITSGPFAASAVTGLSLTSANQPNGIGALVNQASGGLSYTSAGGIDLTVNIGAFGQAVNLTSMTGALAQTGGQTITATTLSALATTGVTFTDANQVTNLGAMTSTASGGISFLDVGSFGLAGFIQANRQTVNLTSSIGSIGQFSGGISASALNASAVTGISLQGANNIASLGALTNSISGGINIANDANITLTSNVSAPGQAVSLYTGIGAITQSGGIINAATLNALGDTGVALNDANALTGLGSVINNGAGGISIVNTGSLTLAGDVDAFGQSVSLTSSNGALTQSGGTIATGTFSASALTGITLNDANAVSVVSGLGNTGSGGISFTNAGDFNVAGGVYATGQALSLVSTSGSITQTAGVITAQDLTLTAQAGVNLINAVGSNSATVTATTLSLTPQGSSNNALQAPTVVIESRSGLIDLGDNLTDPGFTGMTISSATAMSIGADSFSFYAGYFSPANRLVDLAPQQPVAIKVGDITAQFNGMDNPAGGISVSFFAGPGSAIEVLGSIASINPGQGHLFVGDKVADTWTPGSILVSGSLGASGATIAPLDSIELNATNNILLGDSQFQQAILNAEQSGQTQFINIKAGEPAGVAQPGTGQIFIGSNTLTMRAQGVIASQNTGVTTTTTTTSSTGAAATTTTVAYGGIDLVNGNGASTALTLGTTQAAASRTSPMIVDIFGTLNDAAGTAITGMDLASTSAITLEAPLVISDFYRANGCVIGRVAACNLLTVQTLPVKLILGVTLPGSDEGDPASSSAAGSAAATAKPIIYTATTPLIGYTPPEPIGDPTVTGVGSEEIWRGPVCDPSGGAKCS